MGTVIGDPAAIFGAYVCRLVAIPSLERGPTVMAGNGRIDRFEDST